MVVETAIQTAEVGMGYVLHRDTTPLEKGAKVSLRPAKIAATVKAQLFRFMQAAIFKSPSQDVSHTPEDMTIQCLIHRYRKE